MKTAMKKALAFLLSAMLIAGFFPAIPAFADDIPFTAGEGGAMPAMPVFAANPDTAAHTFAGLLVKDSERWRESDLQGGFLYKPIVDLSFPTPSSFGASGYTLEYSLNGTDGWAPYLSFSTAEADEDSFSFYPSASGYYRLLAGGGTVDGYVSNAVYAPAEPELVSGDSTYFSSLNLDESMNLSPTGTMCPFVGRGLKATASVKSLVHDGDIAGGVSFQWYRVDPGTFAAAAIDGATGDTYVTTDADIGYKILVKATGDESAVNGFYQMLSASDVVFPNEARASGIDAGGFTLNLSYAAPGLTKDELSLSYNGSALPISALTETGEGEGDNAVFRVAADLSGVPTNGILTLTNRSDKWKISNTEHMGDRMPFLSFAKPYQPMADTAELNGDADHIYFEGDNLSLNLTGLPAALEGQNVRVAFGILDASGGFLPADVISGLIVSADNVPWFTAASVVGGRLNAPISGAVQSGLPAGMAAVKLYIQMGMQAPWIDALSAFGGGPAYLPLVQNDRPAFVGFDNVLPAGITTEPAWRTIRDFYDGALDIKFIKSLGNGDTGAIAFTGIALANRETVKQLSLLGSALLIREDSPGAGSGIDRQLTFGVDDSALSALASLGAVISVRSDSFAGLSEYNFNLGACEVGGEAYLVRSFDAAAKTVSFTVPHFSNYVLTEKSGVSRAAVTCVKTDASSFAARDGTLTLTPSGGSGGGNYAYTLDGGKNWHALSGVIASLAPGSYQVGVRDTDDTSNVSEEHSVAIGPAAVRFTCTKANASAPSAADGSITTVPSGGKGSYDYSLTDGDSWNALPPSGVISGLDADTYRVKLRDAADTANASETANVTILEPTVPAAPNVSRDDDADSVSGMAAGMEYSLDGAAYAAYNAQTFAVIGFGGTHTLLVRVASDGYNPAGAVTTLTFTPAAPVLGSNYALAAGTDIDAAADGAGNVCAVYVSGGTVYYAKNRETPEAIAGGGSDASPSLAVQADGTAHAVFVRNGEVTYAKRAPAGGWTVTDVAPGSAPDIDADAGGHAHIVYEANTDGDAYAEIVYSSNSSGAFASATIWDGNWDYWQGSGSGDFFQSPSIKVDGSGKYHISARHQYRNVCSGDVDNRFGIVYATNSGSPDIGASFGNNASVSQSEKSLVIGAGGPEVFFGAGGSLYAAPSTALVSGADPAAAACGARTGLAFDSSGVKYILNTGAGFSAAANIDPAGTNPAAAIDASNAYVYYEKNGRIYLASDKSIAPPVTPGVTDSDADGVYFAGDTLSFNLAGLDAFNGKSLRLAFGTVDETGAFTPAAVTDGLTAGTDGGTLFYKTAAVSGGSFASDISGTVLGGLGRGAIGVGIYYEDAQGAYVSALASQPKPYIVLTKNGHSALAGVALPEGISCFPALGSGDQDKENLYNEDIAFCKTIASGVTGKISFKGLDLISCGAELADLADFVSMTKAGDAGLGYAEKYLIGVEVSKLVFLGGRAAAISVTSPSFKGETVSDFTAAAADASGGAVSNLSVAPASGEVSFGVSHFSGYSLSRKDPNDADADGYYDGDIAAIRAFLEQSAAVPGQKNGDVVLTGGYDGDDTSTYAHFPFFTWNNDKPKRLTGIRLDSNNGYHSRDLAGTLDARALTALESLIIEDTDSNSSDNIADGVTAIGVAGLTKLGTLHVGCNSLTSLDVSGCGALTDLNCQENLIGALTLTGAVNLEQLDCGYNGLTDLNLTGLTKLTKLQVFNNRLSSLDTSRLSALNYLDCQANLLTGLDLSGNMALESLCCPDNALTSLGISGMEGLKNLYCAGNRLAFSALPLVLPSGGGSYSYAPQQAVPLTLESGNAADLSAEKSFGGSATRYRWYNAANDAALSDGITESPSGVFTFDRAIFAGTRVYCVMTNGSFPDLGGNSALRTAPATILNLPQLAAPNPAAEGSTVSWSAVNHATGYLVRIRSGGTDVREPIATTGLSVSLARLPGENRQSLPSGSYTVAVEAAGDPAAYLASPYSAAVPVALTTKTALEQVNASANARDPAGALLAAVAADREEFGLADSFAGTSAKHEYADLSDTGKAAVGEAMTAGLPFRSDADVTSAFNACLRDGVLADERLKYENSVTLFYDASRADDADVESLVRVLKSGKTADADVSVSGRQIRPGMTANTLNRALLSTDSAYVSAPGANWTGANGTATITFTLSYAGLDGGSFDVAVTLAPTPASVVIKSMNDADSASDPTHGSSALTVLESGVSRGAVGADGDGSAYWNGFTAAEKAAVAAAVWNGGVDYALSPSGKDALAAAYDDAARQVFIERAKAIIGNAFTAVEGRDTNLARALSALPGMADTGVTVAVSALGAPEMPVTVPGGDITYNQSRHRAPVTLALGFGPVSDRSFAPTVTIPAHDAVSPVPGGNGTIRVSETGANSLRLSWTAAGDEMTAADTLRYYVICSSSDNIATAGDMRENGTLLNSGGTANLDAYTVSGLSAGTKYYFNIGVRDLAGNTGVYTAVSATTSSAYAAPAPAAPPVPEVRTAVTGTLSTASTSVTGTADAGRAVASLSQSTVGALIDSAVRAETAGQRAVVQITLQAPADTSGGEVRIPREAFNQIAASTNAEVQVSTPLVSLTLSPAAMDSISGGTGTGDIRIGADLVPAPTLSPDTRLLLGGRPVFSLSVSSGGSLISTFGGAAISVSLPYVPSPGENPLALVPFYLSGTGTALPMPGGFNPRTGSVDFTTVHLSRYAVGYNAVTFSDVSERAWYGDAVTFLAARGITAGVGGARFAPDASVTRAEFLVMLMRAYGISPDESAQDNFSDAGSAYYSGYLATAKRLGIASGTGDGLFSPESGISRQDMFTLLYRALDKQNELPDSVSGSALSDFRDADQIPDYAKTAVSSLAASGVIAGSDGLISGGGASTRAQTAEVLYRLLSR